MKEWKEVKLGDIVEVNPKESIMKGTVARKISMVDLIPFTRQPAGCTFEPYNGGTKFRNKDIIMARITPCLENGKAAYISDLDFNEIAYGSTEYIVFRAIPQSTNSKFIYYFICEGNFRNTAIASMTGSSGRQRVQTKELLDFNFLLPPLKEQKAIAEVLSSLDDKIELLQKQNETLEQLAETLFRQWFIEEAEEDWEEQTLGDVINLYDFKRIPLSKIERSKMKDGQLYPYYGAATIMDYVNSYIFEGDYILMAEDGSVQTEEGYPVLQYARGKFWVNNHAHILTGISPYSNSFIWMFLKTKNIQQYITGAVQPKLNQKNLKSITFPKYPQSRVFYYTKIVSPYFDKIESNQLQIQTLTEMRDTLLPKLMSGEVRVKLAD